MTTQEAIEFIRINRQYRDKKAICERAGVSRQTFNNMMKKALMKRSGMIPNTKFCVKLSRI